MSIFPGGHFQVRRRVARSFRAFLPVPDFGCPVLALFARAGTCCLYHIAGHAQAGGPLFPCFSFPFRNSGCPVLALFARAGTMLPVPSCLSAQRSASPGSARGNEGWTRISFRDRAAEAAPLHALVVPALRTEHEGRGTHFLLVPLGSKAWATRPLTDQKPGPPADCLFCALCAAVTASSRFWKRPASATVSRRRIRRHAGTHPPFTDRARGGKPVHRDASTEAAHGATLPPKSKRRDPRQPGLFARESQRRAFWQARFYDFNVWTTRKRVEKLRYMHRNPVKRRLVESPEQWRWSSYRFYLVEEVGSVRVNEG